MKSGRHRRHSLRLTGFDYGRVGAYFVTVVVNDGLCLFGEIVEETMRLNEAGTMAVNIWATLPRQFPTIKLDAFAVMPNHIHGILMLNPPEEASLEDDRQVAGPDAPSGATTRVAPTVDRYTLGNVIGAYKSLTTVEYGRGVKGRGWPPFNGRLWQRNYYEHVIRNDASLRRIHEYVHNNPARWSFDHENSLAVNPQDL